MKAVYLATLLMFGLPVAQAQEAVAPAPAAQAPAKAQTPKPRPRQGADMRHCLELKDNKAIIRCAEPGRRP